MLGQASTARPTLRRCGSVFVIFSGIGALLARASARPRYNHGINDLSPCFPGDLDPRHVGISPCHRRRPSDSCSLDRTLSVEYRADVRVREAGGTAV